MILSAVPSGFLIFFAVLSNSAATIFLRKGAPFFSLNSDKFPFLPTTAFVLGSAALVFYMSAFVFYALTLQRLPMSLAYIVITSLTQLVLLSYGLTLLQETLSSTSLIGVGLTMAGLALIFVGR